MKKILKIIACITLTSFLIFGVYNFFREIFYPTPPSAQLLDKQWRFVSYNGIPEYKGYGHLIFRSVGKYESRFCNVGNGGLSFDGYVIYTTPGSGTLMACIGSQSMEMDDRFLKFLEKKPVFSLENKMLTLASSDGEVFVFTFDKNVSKNAEFFE